MKAKTVWKEASMDEQGFWVWGGTDQGVFGLTGDVRWVNVLGVELYDMSVNEDGKS